MAQPPLGVQSEGLTGERKGGKSYKQRGRETNHETLKYREQTEGGCGVVGEWVMGTEDGTCWDEHWVLYVGQFDNKLYSLKKWQL